MLRHVLSCYQSAVFTFAYVYSRISIKNGVSCGVSKIPIAMQKFFFTYDIVCSDYIAWPKYTQLFIAGFPLIFANSSKTSILLTWV